MPRKANLDELLATAAKLKKKADAVCAELKLAKTALLAGLQAARVTEHTAPDGSNVKRVEISEKKWDALKLEKVLSGELYSAYCPHKPDGKLLAAYLGSATGKLAKNLGNCFEVETSERLEIKPS